MKRCPMCGYEEMPGELRSNAQGKRYWGVTVGRIREHLERQKGHGVSKYQVHEGLKAGYLGMEDNPFGGPPIPVSTTVLSVKEFSLMMERIEADFAAMGVDFTHRGRTVLEADEYGPVVVARA